MDDGRIPSAVDVEQLSALAKHFARQDMLAEAMELFELALRFEPDNRGLQLSLAQIRNRFNHERQDQERGLEATVRETMRRDAIDASHFCGLADLYIHRGKPELASECLDIAIDKNSTSSTAFKLKGQLLTRAKDYDGARHALRTAHRFNPFDRDVSIQLGRVEYERESYHDALDASVDGFLLLADDDRDDAGRLKEQISELKKLLDLSSEALVERFRDRRTKLQTAFDRLELQRERYLQKLEDRPPQIDTDPEAGRIMMAARLRKLDLWARLNDEHIFQLTRVAEEETVERGELIFELGDSGGDLYLLEQGEVTLQRPTSYGKFELARITPGQLFGEVNFVSRSQRAAEAHVDQAATLVRIDAARLEAVIDERPDLGVKVYSCLWQGLAIKLRAANEKLRTFFTDEAGPDTLLELRQRAEGDAIDIGSSEKMDLLREQGLTGSELQTLADFSNVKRYPGGTFLFHEGDPGSEMYVVLDGRVMISKYIPGGGEEALAILQRGDFFGEMSLIDGQPRSADAKAFSGPATVVAFDDLTLQEVQAVDPRASLDFIRLLCRLMCQRLREIDEKVTGWRIMAGHQGGDGSQIQFPEPASSATAK